LGGFLLEIFKLRLSALADCVLGCFFGLGLEGFCVLFVWDGRFATFHVDFTFKLLSDIGNFDLTSFHGIPGYRPGSAFN